MISTSCITGTGFMKCMPMTRSGRSTPAAMRVIGMEDVFVARIAPGCIARDRLSKTFLLTVSFSVTASTANCALRASSYEPPRRRPTVACASSALSFPFPTALSSCARIPASPFSTKSRLTSMR